MFRRLVSARAALLSKLAAALLLASSVVAIGAADYVRLDVDELAASRGSNQNNVLTHLSCDAYNNNKCTGADIGKPCNLCEVSTYTWVTPGSFGGYDAVVPPFGGCGFNFRGACSISLQCKGADTWVGYCNTPGKVIVQTDPDPP